jgi:hypothetical protein
MDPGHIEKDGVLVKGVWVGRFVQRTYWSPEEYPCWEATANDCVIKNPAWFSRALAELGIVALPPSDPALENWLAEWLDAMFDELDDLMWNRYPTGPDQYTDYDHDPTDE